MATSLQHQDVYRSQPHVWQTSLWARVVRRAGRHWTMSRHVRRYCQPLAVEGRETLRDVTGPALIIVNHSSHFDTVVALSVLPERLRARTAVAAAADRFYQRAKRGWWYSLFFNAFPIERRGGGAETLAYPISLLRRGWSVLIYPEGTRSTTGELGRFHHGVAMMAMQAHVPVIPIYAEGLREVMPKTQRAPRASGVRVRVGAPVSLEHAASVPEATAQLEARMRGLAAAAWDEPRVAAPARQVVGATP
jgi:1-acyl-sn-glycerol-3-phosphate acyltransferase